MIHEFLFLKRNDGGVVEITRARTRNIEDFIGLGARNGMTVF